MKVLVVVDMQNDFVYGSLGTEEAKAIVPNVVNKINRYMHEEDTTIFCTFDTHAVNYLGTQEGHKLPVAHCIKGTDGWNLIPEIQSLLQEDFTPVEKVTFGSVDLPKRIKDDGNLQIELIGVCTDICVVSNALLLKANYPEVVITVDASCCAGVTPKKHQAALEVMRSCQIDIIEAI